MQTILITGAGSGIGAATARLLSDQTDTRILLIGRNTDSLNKVLASLKNPEIHLAQSIDISKPGILDDFLSDTSTNLKEHPLVSVFANAGIGAPNLYDHNSGEDRVWDEIIGINLTGTYRTCMATIPWLQKAKESGFKTRHIVITSSVLSRFGVPTQPAYVASKTGLLGLVRSLATQYSREGILINAINPGWVNTDMATIRIKEMANEANVSYEDMLTVQESYVTTGKFSEPEEIGALVKFLFSNSQVSITGQAIDINGGAWMG
ncbi:MAG: short-chain dehydrogenase [Bacteroidetes bacterium]|nr:MAG: short-chain dehydrogenase [Bacteroidota bacterium]